MLSITNYKISTITATGAVNIDLNLTVLFDSINVIANENSLSGVAYAEFGSRSKGISRRRKKTSENTSGIKRFDNQLTLEYRFPHEDNYTTLNCKIFKNGNIQMTGIKHVDQGRLFVDQIIDLIKAAPDTVGNKNDLENTRYLIRMINCDYKIGHCVKRDVLFKIMVSEYNNMCSFEPCIYPGVKIQYMWNANNKRCDGNCYCNSQCIYGKGNGRIANHCKKITIAVFQSGCIIITGAQSLEQVNEAYNWMNNILLKHSARIEKKILPVANKSSQSNKKKIVISKSKIISFRD